MVCANHIGLRERAPDLDEDGYLNCRDDLFGDQCEWKGAKGAELPNGCRDRRYVTGQDQRTRRQQRSSTYHQQTGEAGIIKTRRKDVSRSILQSKVLYFRLLERPDRDR